MPPSFAAFACYATFRFSDALLPLTAPPLPIRHSRHEAAAIVAARDVMIYAPLTRFSRRRCLCRFIFRSV
jgi:hypothetical protein